MNRRALLRLAWAWAAIGAAGCGGDDGALPRVPATADVLALERQMAERVNRDRASQGLPPLSYDDRLAEVARVHADDMRTNRFFSHDSPTTGSLDDRLVKAGYGSAVARENLAEAPDVDNAEKGLLESPGHRANIMSPDVTHVGVGVVRGGLGDPTNFLFVQVFSRPVERETVEQTESRVLERVAKERKAKGLAPLSRHDLLDDLARRLIGDVPDSIPASALERAGKAAVSELSKRKASLSGVSVTGAFVLASSEYNIPQAVVSSSARAFGLAVASGKDERGHVGQKILLLVGQ
jgi:uncharacterized protein YkwD